MMKGILNNIGLIVHSKLALTALYLLIFHSHAIAYNERLKEGNSINSVPVKVLIGHRGGAIHAVFSPDNQLLASCGFDSTIKIWNVADWKLLKVLRGHLFEVNTVVFSRDGNHLVSSSYDHTVRVWDVKSGKLLRNIKFSSWSIAMDFSQNGLLGIGLEDGNIVMLNIATGDTTHTNKADFPINALTFSSLGKYFVTGGPLVLWDAEKMQRIKSFIAPGGVNAAQFSPDGNFLASAHMRGIAYVWHIPRGDTLFSIKSEVTINAPAPSGTIKTTVRLPVVTLAFSSDSKYVAAGGADKLIRIRSLRNDALMKVFEAHTKTITGLCYSSNGKYLASCSLDGTIKIWNVN